MGVVVTACGRVTATRPLDHARILADLVPPEVLEALVRFVLDGGRGSVVLQVRERNIAGVRIDAIVM